MKGYPTAVARRGRPCGDRSRLQALKNPSSERYEIQIHCPEITFIGRKEQPDFGCLDITFVPSDTIIELKSLKRYLYSFREALMSYERFINVLYEDLMATYHPARMILEMHLRPRGGISSRLKIDSAWRSGRKDVSPPLVGMLGEIPSGGEVRTN